MKILLLGSGGREHALAWKISQSPHCSNLYIAPGNAGTLLHGTNIDLNPNDFDQVASFVSTNKIDMLVVGPEEPLVLGIVDYFAQHPSLSHLMIIGPNSSGARLEGSKDFSKQFMVRHGIPTARYQSFTPETIEQGKLFLRDLSAPYVLKASGIAAGKGVVILNELPEAEKELEEMLSGKFGDAGNVVVIEEFLEGIECSVFILSDGKDYVLLPEAKDYKRIGEGDTGLNTGGMGAVSPVAFCTPEFMEKVKTSIINPTIQGLQKEGIDYKGFIFFGLMNVKGEPFVIEYNCRMGDPETEVVIPRIQNDLVELFSAMQTSGLKNHVLKQDERFAVTVMCVAGGYPGHYEKGKEIKGLAETGDNLVFHAGTRKDNNQVLTNGGRVMAFTSLSPSLKSALDNSYETIKKVGFEGMYYRKDIGNDLIYNYLN